MTGRAGGALALVLTVPQLKLPAPLEEALVPLEKILSRLEKALIAAWGIAWFESLGGLLSG